ncbi:MAG TPA: HNH endonuclease [Candidatus Eisenbacteria bacterium]|nr:HNH endonuclease [Candidatus Eisenbacteria bacterium]
MRCYTLAHLSDETLLRHLSELIARERATTAEVLAHIAEVDARRLYLPAGHSSMHTYCVNVLKLSDDAAFKRIQVARAARRFPVLFEALADGRLHLAGACLLAPHLTPQNLEELMSAATHRRKSEIEVHLARLFPDTRTVEPTPTVRALPAIRPPLAPGQVGRGANPPFDDVAGSQLGLGESGDPSSPAGVTSPEPERPELAPGQAGAPSAPLPYAERYLVRLTIGKDLHDKLRYAQALLSHAVPTGDVAEVLDRALDTLIVQLERQKIGSRTRSRTYQRIVERSRYVPASVRRAVWERDKSRCTFVGANGHRCEAKRFLEIDHVQPYARGGKHTLEGLRLRCRAHNQYEAERLFGSKFMNRKRAEARKRARQTADDSVRLERSGGLEDSPDEGTNQDLTTPE